MFLEKTRTIVIRLAIVRDSDKINNDSSFNIVSHLIDSQPRFPYTDSILRYKQPYMKGEDSAELKYALKTFWEQEAEGLCGKESDDEKLDEPKVKLGFQFDDTWL